MMLVAVHINDVFVSAQYADLTMPFSLPWSKEHAQRKYIDLIKEASAKWANWDPPKRVQVSFARPFIHAL